MKETIRHILKETVDKRNIGELFLSRFNLKPWENKRYGMEYLATPGNTVIFLISKQDNSLSVQKEIYNQLSRIFKDDAYLEEFIIQYVENYGLSTSFEVWIESSSNLGTIEDDDEPITWDEEDEDDDWE
jgi:hypothetical protein